MAATPSVFPFLLHLLHLLSTAAGAALGPASHQEADLPQTRPQLSDCVSADMETFRCRWDAGTFLNLSEPGQLRLFYINKKSVNASPARWNECPQYNGASECFFNKSYTTIWTPYSVELRSGDRAVLYDQDAFTIEEIVRPDPPVSLNWTLLGADLTETHFNLKLSWRPPQSADVEMGWMTLQYQVQHREAAAGLWKESELQRTSEGSLYGLQTNVEYEVRLRCRMLAAKHFGDFSESLFIQVPSKVSRFPIAILFVLGALCFIGILMLLMQQKLMVILLPPIPGPKIRGIDQELLKKGKLSELMSVLGAQNDLSPKFYNSDPWVEFIDLDMDEQDGGAAEDIPDAERSLSFPSSDRSPLSIGFQDDDSGHASCCCDPDLPFDPEASSRVHASSPGGLGEGLYAQLGHAWPPGELLLTEEEKTTARRDDDNNCKEDIGAEKNEGQSAGKNSAFMDYASELDAGKKSPGEGDSMEVEDGADHGRLDPESSVTGPQASVYTVVEGVDGLNSLVLTPNTTTPTLHPPPQHHRQVVVVPSKVMPTPQGYLTPDLLENITR